MHPWITGYRGASSLYWAILERQKSEETFRRECLLHHIRFIVSMILNNSLPVFIPWSVFILFLVRLGNTWAPEELGCYSTGSPGSNRCRRHIEHRQHSRTLQRYQTSLYNFCVHDVAVHNCITDAVSRFCQGISPICPDKHTSEITGQFKRNMKKVIVI